MTLSQTTITGSFKTPKGAPAPITDVVFKLKGSDYEDGELIVVAEAPAESIDTEAGTFSATLWPNDRGSRGDTRYTVVFRFADGSTVTGISDLYVRYSDTPVTLEDMDFQTRAGAAVKPYGLVIVRQSQFDPEGPMDPNSVYLILQG